MERSRVKELEKRPFAQIFPSAIKNIQAGNCATCGAPINLNSFKNDISKKEFTISGMCQKCQDSVFESGDDE